MGKGMEPISEADYIIVGGGTAGCVLANRLSENPQTRVLMLEAGGSDDSFLVRMPAGMARLIARPGADWCYMAEPDPSINGRRHLWSAGRMLGGSSSINGQVYIRGLRSDYDGWAKSGCAGWSFDEVLPYFLKSERYEGSQPLASHARKGGLSVSPMRYRHPLTEVFLGACGESGWPRLADYCAGEQLGCFETLATQRDGLRCSSARANLETAAQRPNLEILTGCAVQNVVLVNGRASGVRFRRGGRLVEARARAEVLICAGAVSSPAVLMRSGIGPGAHLQSLGVTVAVDVPEVGRNLQEHPAVGVSKRVTVPTINSLGPLQLLGQALRFLTAKQGLLTTPAIQAMAFIKTRTGLADPDVQLHFTPLTFDIEDATVSSASAKMPKMPAVLINANICRPHSRGQIRLRSADAGEPPVIDHRLLGDERDVATLVAACRKVEAIFEAPSFKPYVAGDYAPKTRLRSDREWQDYARAKSVICYHPVGTCRMGADAGAVVDPALRVRGVEGLRVVDASIMPVVTSANTNAPTIMVAEKAADLILNRRTVGGAPPRTAATLNPEEEHA